ncbi:hypothetical protein [Halalkalibacter okhensis]|uniref:Uncharacterized protein n=1 Tax=Halalkalibacter okhensis TaxID=333138 RepID=A0A0B0IE18_9BACI|nr:hypothetical protein [Halalkalibacter okhensis]KHF39560.1 hypothetical protein LQ50_14010 [Halalkalibacter okhensis]
MKSKKAAYIIVYSLMAIFGVVIAINWYSVSQNEEAIEDSIEEEEAVEVITVGHEEEVDETDQSNDDSPKIEGETGEIIKAVHGELNQLVGWNGYIGFSWGKNENNLNGIIDELQVMLDIETNEALRNDAKRTIEAIERALDANNVEEVRLAHKIMHDLDYYVNGRTGDGKRYGVTEYR